MNAATVRLLPAALRGADGDGLAVKPRQLEPAPRHFGGIVSVLQNVTHVIRAIQDGDRARLFATLDCLLRHAVPCESFSLYLVEDAGRKLRCVHPYLEVGDPEPVVETTMEGWAVLNADIAKLPSNGKYALDWASHECYRSYALPTPVRSADPSQLPPWPPTLD